MEDEILGKTIYNKNQLTRLLGSRRIELVIGIQFHKLSFFILLNYNLIYSKLLNTNHL